VHTIFSTLLFISIFFLLQLLKARHVMVRVGGNS
jgi:hypothetical protein